MKIVNVEGKHIHAIHDIYAHHIIHGTGSFETDPPNAHEILARLEKTRSLGLPWVVVLQGDKVTGYCYLIHYHERYAYRYTLEDSIYIDSTVQHRGAEKTLLHHVIGWAGAQGHRQLIVTTGDGNNQGSLRVHQQAGFTQTGTLKDIGFKHELQLDIILLQHNLDEGNGTLPPDSDVTI